MRPQTLQRIPAAISRPFNALQHTEIATLVNKRRVRFTIALFGPRWGDEKGVNWSLLPFQKEGDAANDPERAERVRDALGSLGTGDYYAPVPSVFNAAISTRESLSERIDLGNNIRLRRGVKADAVPLIAHSGATFSTAGCPLFVATDGDLFFAAHAGFRSLFRVEDFQHSVIKNIAKHFSSPTRVRTWFFFSIKQERHLYSLKDKNPEYRKNNEVIHSALNAYGYGDAITAQGGIDLVALARRQCRELGFTAPERTALSYLPSGAYDTRMPLPDRDQRNLTVLFLHELR